MNSATRSFKQFATMKAISSVLQRQRFSSLASFRLSPVTPPETSKADQELENYKREGVSMQRARKEYDEQYLSGQASPPGGAPGAVPTDYEQATGLERLELLARLAGGSAFDMRPIDSSRMGTLSEPVKVPSPFHTRYIGCTGHPADSHPVQYMTLVRDSVCRCPECGNVFSMEYSGPEGEWPEGHPNYVASEGHHH